MKRYKKIRFSLKISKKTILCIIAIFIGSLLGAIFCNSSGFPLIMSASDSAFLLSSLKIAVFIGILAFTLFGVFAVPIVVSFFGFSVSYLLINSFTVLFLIRCVLLMPVMIFLCVYSMQISASFCGIDILVDKSEEGYKNLLLKFFVSLFICAILIVILSMI